MQPDLDQNANDASSTVPDDGVKNETSSPVDACEQNDPCIIEIDDGDGNYKHNVNAPDENSKTAVIQPVDLPNEIIHQNRIISSEVASNSCFPNAQNFKLFQNISASLHQIAITHQRQSSSPNQVLVDSSGSLECTRVWIESEIHEVEIVTTTTECRQIVMEELVAETPRKRKNKIKTEDNSKRRRSMDIRKSTPGKLPFFVENVFVFFLKSKTMIHYCIINI